MEKYRKINGGTYTGERALFMLANAVVSDATFCDGESPLKESLNIDIIKCTFDWKYPIWYAKNIEVTDSRLNPPWRRSPSRARKPPRCAGR